jgi:hypothetical protein
MLIDGKKRRCFAKANKFYGAVSFNRAGARVYGAFEGMGRKVMSLRGDDGWVTKRNGTEATKQSPDYILPELASSGKALLATTFLTK